MKSEIIQYLETRQQASVDELAAALGQDDLPNGKKASDSL